MKVFISWSKDRSRGAAVALQEFLGVVLQQVQPWVSASDIDAGARWSAEIAAALSASKVGILCVTPENQHEPWLQFEAGALAKTLEGTFVCPYLIGMKKSDLAKSPLTQFQAKEANREDTWSLLQTINRALKEQAVGDDPLRRLFDAFWPELERKLAALPPVHSPPKRSADDMTAEILELVRGLSRQRPATSDGFVPIPTPAELELEIYRQERAQRVSVAAAEMHAAFPAISLDRARKLAAKIPIRKFEEFKEDLRRVAAQGPHEGADSEFLAKWHTPPRIFVSSSTAG
jgi:hypothetical protein